MEERWMQHSLYEHMSHAQIYSLNHVVPEPSRLSIWRAKDSYCKSNGTSLSAMRRLPRPLISETISRRRNALFGHMARLSDDVPAHTALNCQVNLSLGRPPSSQWHRRPGRPRNGWVDQIRNDNNLPPADLWRRTVSCGHCGGTLRPLPAKRWQQQQYGNAA